MLTWWRLSVLTGRILSGSATQAECVMKRMFSLPNSFAVNFLRTTAVNRFVTADVSVSQDEFMCVRLGSIQSTR